MKTLGNLNWIIVFMLASLILFASINFKNQTKFINTFLEVNEITTQDGCIITQVITQIGQDTYDIKVEVKKGDDLKMIDEIVVEKQEIDSAKNDQMTRAQFIYEQTLNDQTDDL